MEQNKKGKLSLNKETISKLNDSQMSQVKGGVTTSQETRCCGYTATEYCCQFTLDLKWCLNTQVG